MQILDKKTALRIPPIFRLAFRPFFILGSVIAVIGIVLWIMALSNMLSLQPSGGWLAWHRHELVFGFAGAIVAGFLLTAVHSWTGLPSLSGWSLALLTGIWLIARIAWWLDSDTLLLLSGIAFWLGVLGAMAQMLIKVKQKRNYPILLILLLLLLSDALTLLGVALERDDWQRQAITAALWLVAGLMSIIGGRVIPFFTQRGLGRPAMVQPWAWMDWALLGGTLLLALLHASGFALLPHVFSGLLFSLLALGHLIRLVRWFDRDIVRVPLLWSLHLAYAWLVIACGLMALWNFGFSLQFSQALHALTIGSIGGLILAMIARVSLGHTGRPLTPPAGFSAAFIALNIAALARIVAPAFAYLPTLWVAAFFWTWAFLQFAVCYGPMLFRTRADGHPG